jgi:hypothetical protein
MWWIITGVIVFSVVIYFLFAPFFVEIDSNTGLFRIRFHHLAKVDFVFRESSIFLKVKVAWWQKEIDLLEKKPLKRKKELPVAAGKELKKKEKEFSFRKMLRKIKGVMKSFRVRQCFITIDTGDMPANGILYPWFWLLSRATGQTVLINFWGENEIVLKIENSVARMLRAYIAA